MTIENTYNDIRNIGKIFNREDRAEELVKDMETRLSKVQESIKDKDKISVLSIDSIVSGSVATWGGTGLPNHLVELAGAENVFKDVDQQFDLVSWEELLDTNPDYIIINIYGDDESKGQDMIDYLKEDPQTSELDAVKNDKFIKIPVFSTMPNLHNIDTVEAIAEAVINQ